MYPRQIEVSFPMVVNGDAVGPTSKDHWKEIMSIFPTTRSLFIGSPYMIIQVQELPPQPWPVSVGRIPLCLSLEEGSDAFDRGRQGRSRVNAMPQYNLRGDAKPPLSVFTDIVDDFKWKHVIVREIFHFLGFFRLTVANSTDLETLPYRIANQAAFYKFCTEERDPSALRIQQPSGVLENNINSLADETKCLFPGVMVSSSLSDGSYRSTTMGVLVVDASGATFITVASHAFNPNGEIWYPDPSGTLIGRMVRNYPESGIALVQLQDNIDFDNKIDSAGITLSCVAERSQLFDNIRMDNAFSGSCVGQIAGFGLRAENYYGVMTPHYWAIMDDKSHQHSRCGSAVLNDAGEVVGFFKFARPDSRDCYVVSSEILIQAGYQIPNPSVQRQVYNINGMWSRVATLPYERHG
jgi:hypothetical protein